ncbi:sensor histidine kinase [Variovorax sp. HJSM1_2]|uniref:sensor histidine kinase n=1 Tax=Variovorax sp. HJSM1_2 TaxID=3366263 RepID=UPI003BD6BCE7
MKVLRTDPDRFGIRARLLTLLLPGILGLLVLDSWNDYRALRNLVQDTYDQSMLESATTLRSRVSLAADGAFRLEAPFVSPVAEDVAHAGAAPQKFWHVAVTPQRAAVSPPAAASNPVILLGEADLPAPPLPPAAPPTVGPSGAIWYDSYYRGQSVRVVALQSQLRDQRGRPYDLLVQLAESTGPRDRVQAASSEQALLRDTRMLLVVILLVWLGVTWSLHPLEKLRKSVLDSKGHELQPLDTSGVPHEVAPLVAAINLHVARYRELLDQQSQFLADASHQLRTPLAIMLTQAGVALREKDADKVQQTLRAIVAQIARSRRLCEQLLSLADAHDSAAPVDAPVLVDLNHIAKEVVLQYLTLAHEKQQDLGWVDARDQADVCVARPDEMAVPVLARALELHESLANLVHNAIVYTPVGGRITVKVYTHEGRALAEVSDNGPGIAEALREVVFERFQQGTADPAKSSRTGSRGSGLGLAIARAYARRNGGDISLADATAEANTSGLRATLQLTLVT